MAESKCQDKPTKQLSVLHRSSNYRAKCKTGHRTGDWEAHHILCNVSMQKRHKFIQPKFVDYVEECLWITEWDLNDSSNLIGLPLNKEYSDTNLPGYCSHQVDHTTSDGYTKECSEWLARNVWRALERTRNKHTFDPKQLAAALKKCTTTFKGRLRYRATRKGGQQHCWDRRLPKNRGYVEEWYFPFSMGDAPRRRSPGMSSKRLAGIFAMIK